MKNNKITTEGGCPVNHYEDSQSVGPRGPLLLQDYFLHEKLAHFNRERIPERVVHAKGSGAFGKFVVTHDISMYSRAKIFSKIGNQCKLFARFSTVGGEKGSADSERDPRGFALKFYTEDGNWDLVGNNTPVFFVKDPKKFPDFIHTQKRDPRTNCKSPTMMWDYWSLNPESLHQVMILMSDRGTPYGYRHMNGYGSHTFSMINNEDQRVWVKFHFKTEQGIKNFTNVEAEEMRGEDPDFAQRDLVEAIDKGRYPRWKMKIQVMTNEEAANFKWNPFDLSKVWPHAEHPLIDVGYIELNEIPNNYFQDVEQSAFAPSKLIDGIGFSPDKMLQGRILSYPDAHRYRLGVNFEQLPVNRCPYGVNNYHRDGSMSYDGNGGSSPNYYPNSFDKSFQDDSYKGNEYVVENSTVAYHDRNKDDDDHYSQPKRLYELVMSTEEKGRLVENVIASMRGISGPKKEDIILRQLCHWFRCSPTLGMEICKGLDIDMQTVMSFMPSHG